MATSVYSAGARYERDAFRDYLRRFMKRMESGSEYDTVREVLAWVLKRQARYNKKPKGLGK